MSIPDGQVTRNDQIGVADAGNVAARVCVIYAFRVDDKISVDCKIVLGGAVYVRVDLNRRPRTRFVDGKRAFSIIDRYIGG